MTHIFRNSITAFEYIINSGMEHSMLCHSRFCLFNFILALWHCLVLSTFRFRPFLTVSLSGLLCLLPFVCLPMPIGRPPRGNTVPDKHSYLSDKMAETFRPSNLGGDEDVFRSGGPSTTVPPGVSYGLERYDNMDADEKVLLVDAINKRLEADAIAAGTIPRKISIPPLSGKAFLARKYAAHVRRDRREQMVG